MQQIFHSLIFLIQPYISQNINQLMHSLFKIYGCQNHIKNTYKITYKNNPVMFRNTKETSSGGEHLCLAKVTCGSMVLVRVNSVSIVGAYINCCVCVCVFVCGSLCDPHTHTHTTAYICPHNTDRVHMD